MTGDRLLVGGPAPVFQSTFLQTCLKTLINNGDRILFEVPQTNEKYTFNEIHHHISGMTRKLTELGQGPGDIVLVFANNTIEALVTILGVWFSGAAAAAVNPLLPLDELRSFLKICKSVVVFVAEDCVERLNSAIEHLDYNVTVIAPNGRSPALNFYDCIKSTKELITEVKYDQDHCLSVMFTSGTTGIPKGAIISDNNCHYNGYTFTYDGRGKRKILLSSPIYWISNSIMLSFGLLTESSFVLVQKPPPAQILCIITEYKPDDWFTSPAVLVELSHMDDLNGYDTSSLNRVTVGGSFLHMDNKRLITEKVFKGRNIIRIGYGSTEGGLITMDRTSKENEEVADYGVGDILNGVTLKVLDEATGETLGPSSPGKMCVRSPGVIRGYINKNITENELDKDGFWHVGDIGYYTEKRHLYYLSRATEILKYRGQQIAPVELESIIQKHPCVRESAVVGKVSNEDGDLPTAFVVKKPNSNLTEQELFDFVAKDVIDEKKLRGGIIFVEQLPKSAVGKVLRRDLVKMLANFA